jgi:hypothetical protein
VRVKLSSSRPELTFACELDPARLTALFADSSVIEDLLALGARVTLMLSDFSDERAGVVQRLNAAGIPVVGIPLLPLAQGYYFTADNAAEAAGRYQEWRAWTRRHGLTWQGVGLDIEPDARIYQQIMDNPWGLVPMLVPRLFDRARPERSRAAYAELVDQIHADGWTVENYQFPLIALAAARPGRCEDRPRSLDALFIVYAHAGPGADLELRTRGACHRRRHHRGRSGYTRLAADAIAELGGAGPGSAAGQALVRSDPDPQPGRVRLARLPGPVPLFRLGRHGRSPARGLGRLGASQVPSGRAVDERSSAGHARQRAGRLPDQGSAGPCASLDDTMSAALTARGKLTRTGFGAPG